MTLHAYSPRLRRMGAYAVASDGALKRHPLGYGEELRPFSWLSRLLAVVAQPVERREDHATAPGTRTPAPRR